MEAEALANGAHSAVPDGECFLASVPEKEYTGTSTGFTAMKTPSSLEKIIVSRDGSGTHRTITDAIASASSGETIEIRSGVYEEVLILEKPVTLVGDPNGFVLIKNSHFTAITIRRTEAILTNIALGECDKQLSIKVEEAQLRLVNCLVAPSVQLAAITSSISAAIPQEQASQWMPLFNDPGFLQAWAKLALSVKCNSTISFDHCLFVNVNMEIDGSEAGASECTFLASTVRVFAKASLSVTKSHFDCGSVGFICNIEERSRLDLSECQIRGIAKSAVICIASDAYIANCDFQGKEVANSGDSQKRQLPPNSYWLEKHVIPSEFYVISQEVYDSLGGDTVGSTAYGRFLVKIGATNDGRNIPDCLAYNPIGKKMIWAYRKKFNTLAYPIGGSGLITKEDVLAPLGAEKDEFLRFFAEQEENEQATRRTGVSCSASLISEKWELPSVVVAGSSFAKLGCAISGHGSGKLDVKDCVFMENIEGIAIVHETGDYRVELRRSRFEKNAHGLRLTTLTSLKNGVVVEDSQVRGNQVGLSFSGWTGYVRRCTFEDNSVSNIQASPLFLLNSVEDCKGFGESTTFKVAQTLRKWLPF
jgi:hypothetical protein